MCEELKRFREEWLFGEVLLLEVRVENHGQIANKNAAQEGDTDFVAAQLDEPVFQKRMQPREFGREIIIEVDAELAANLVLANDGVAQQPRDQGPPQAVIFAEAIPAHGGHAAPFDGFRIATQLSIILRAGGSDGADRADSHSLKLCTGSP